MQSRKIIHIDMDAFFAAVEQRDFPQYRGQPLAVGGSSGRGVVAAASYEARKYGVRSAMPSQTAKRLCPDLIFVKSRFDAYRAVSKQVRQIFKEFTDLVEPLSIDEAYLDVTENHKNIASASLLAEAIRAQIFAETQLTASAGVSYCKFLAKIASDYNKPNGITVIPPAKALAFIAQLPIEKFRGVGKVTAQKMRQHGIINGATLKQFSQAELVNLFGKRGRFFYNISRGIDNRPVVTKRIRKSIGAERTFNTNIIAETDMLTALQHICEKVANRMAVNDCQGRTITLKLKTYDFEIHTRSVTLPQPISSSTEIYGVIKKLLSKPTLPQEELRLLGVTLSNLSSSKSLRAGTQLSFPFKEF